MNAMIDSDNGDHTQSPYNKDKCYTCSTCEGTGRVTDIDDGTNYSIPCEDCKGEGFTDEPSEGWFTKPKKVESIVLESWEKDLLSLALKQLHATNNSQEMTRKIVQIKNKLKL